MVSEEEFLLGFSFLFYAVSLLEFQLPRGKSVKCRFIEFFVLDYDSLPFYSRHSFPYNGSR